MLSAFQSINRAYLLGTAGVTSLGVWLGYKFYSNRQEAKASEIAKALFVLGDLRRATENGGLLAVAEACEAAGQSSELKEALGKPFDNVHRKAIDKRAIYEIRLQQLRQDFHEHVLTEVSLRSGDDQEVDSPSIQLRQLPGVDAITSGTDFHCHLKRVQRTLGFDIDIARRRADLLYCASVALLELERELVALSRWNNDPKTERPSVETEKVLIALKKVSPWVHAADFIEQLWAFTLSQDALLLPTLSKAANELCSELRRPELQYGQQIPSCLGEFGARHFSSLWDRSLELDQQRLDQSVETSFKETLRYREDQKAGEELGELRGLFEDVYKHLSAKGQMMIAGGYGSVIDATWCACLRGTAPPPLKGDVDRKLSSEALLRAKDHPLYYPLGEVFGEAYAFAYTDRRLSGPERVFSDFAKPCHKGQLTRLAELLKQDPRAEKEWATNRFFELSGSYLSNEDLVALAWLITLLPEKCTINLNDICLPESEPEAVKALIDLTLSKNGSVSFRGWPNAYLPHILHQLPTTTASHLSLSEMIISDEEMVAVAGALRQRGAEDSPLTLALGARSEEQVRKFCEVYFDLPTGFNWEEQEIPEGLDGFPNPHDPYVRAHHPGRQVQVTFSSTIASPYLKHVVASAQALHSSELLEEQIRRPVLKLVSEEV